jgi:hypothetical protein
MPAILLCAALVGLISCGSVWSIPVCFIFVWSWIRLSERKPLEQVSGSAQRGRGLTVPRDDLVQPDCSRDPETSRGRFSIISIFVLPD